MKLKLNKWKSFGNKITNAVFSGGLNTFNRSFSHAKFSNTDNPISRQNSKTTNDSYSYFSSQDEVINNIGNGDNLSNIKIDTDQNKTKEVLAQQVISDNFAKSSKIGISNLNTLKIQNVSKVNIKYIESTEGETKASQPITKPKEINSFLKDSAPLFQTYKIANKFNTNQSNEFSALPIVVDNTNPKAPKHSATRKESVFESYQFTNIGFESIPTFFYKPNIGAFLSEDNLSGLCVVRGNSNSSGGGSGDSSTYSNWSFPELNQVLPTFILHIDKKNLKASEKAILYIQELALKFLEKNNGIDAVEIVVPKTGEKVVVYNKNIQNELKEESGKAIEKEKERKSVTVEVRERRRNDREQNKSQYDFIKSIPLLSDNKKPKKPKIEEIFEEEENFKPKNYPLFNIDKADKKNSKKDKEKFTNSNIDTLRATKNKSEDKDDFVKANDLVESTFSENPRNELNSRDDDDCGGYKGLHLGDNDRERLMTIGGGIVALYASYKSTMFLGGLACSAGMGLFNITYAVLTNIVQLAGEMAVQSQYRY